MAVRVLMLDLGETLVHGAEVLPHVPEALEAIARMKTVDGAPLESCLVSDFAMPAPPVTPEKISAIFDDYLSLLEGFGLRSFFQPVERRVTLSTQAGYRKPDRRIFEKALERLGVKAGLPECLFVTEEVAHLQKAARDYHMATLRFGSPEGFTDWAEGPLTIAAKVAGPVQENMGGAAKAWLRATHGLEATEIEVAPGAKTVRALVIDWCALPARELGGESLHVQLPRSVELHLDQTGRVVEMTFGAPTTEAVGEALHFVKTLQANHQLASSHDSPSRATHRVIFASRFAERAKSRRCSSRTVRVPGRQNACARVPFSSRE